MALTEEILCREADITGALENLETLAVCRTCCGTGSAAENVALAMAEVADGLCDTLSELLTRWRRHLPFVEMKDFEFNVWAARMSRLKSDADSMSQKVACNVRLVDSLCRLCDLLLSIYGLECEAIGDETFCMLARMVVSSYCKDLESRQVLQIARWFGQWRPDSPMTAAVEEKRRLTASLDNCLFAEELKKYVLYDSDSTCLTDTPQFGIFLFTNRHRLPMDEVRRLYSLCHAIEILNLFMAYWQNVPACQNVPATQNLSDRKLGILNELKRLVRCAEWRNITPDAVCNGLEAALCPDPVDADDRIREMSAQFWNLLFKRRNCDDDKSLQVTWLNMVGYFVRRGFLSGGSPALCSIFYPNAQEGTYKFIDKGRTGEVKVFSYLEPLLDKCIKWGA